MQPKDGVCAETHTSQSAESDVNIRVELYAQHIQNLGATTGRRAERRVPVYSVPPGAADFAPLNEGFCYSKTHFRLPINTMLPPDLQFNPSVVAVPSR